MAAALSIAVLLTVSFLTVRIAAVVMRHTGIAENVARFQCLSALTGTGFTTSESEMIVNYPIRRRILLMLMIVGNLGLVSIGATFIVSLVQATEQSGAVLYQALMIAGAGGIIFLVMLNKALDRAMCAFIGKVLLRFTSLGERRFQRLLQIGSGWSLAEHIHHGSMEIPVRDLPLLDLNLNIIVIRGAAGELYHSGEGANSVTAGNTLVCFGHDDSHEAFEEFLGARA